MSLDLLELAAHAAGPEIRRELMDNGEPFFIGPAAEHAWNPKDYGDDAMWLATRLRLDIGFDDDCEEVYVRQANDHFSDAVSEPYGDNVDAAARLAVLRMAAEIGRSMSTAGHACATHTNKGETP